MSIRSIVFTLCFAMTVNVGCGEKQESNSINSNGDETVATKTKTELFPQPEFPEIKFSATKRPQPKSIEEAKATLEAIRNLYDWSQVPPAMNKDLTLDGVYQYVTAMKLLQSQVPHDIAWLSELDGIKVPGSDKFSAQSIDSARDQALSRLQEYLPRDIEHSTKYTREFIQSSFAPMRWHMVEQGANCDMDDQSQVRNLLGRENINQRRADNIQRIATAIESAILFDDVLGDGADYDEVKQKLRDTVNRYTEKLEQAANAIQPPKDIGDQELTKIAKDVLSRKKYKLPKAERIIVNAPKKSFGKDHYTIDFGERSIDKSPYRWEEFQVASIEKEGDQHYLYYNTIINYSVGPHTVPTGKWVLGPRHKSAPISAKNINN